MDARIDPARALRFNLGDVHVLRNAGAVVTEDVLRSLVLSQHLLGTRSVVVMAHTDCGLHNLDEAALSQTLRSGAADPPPFAFGAFTSLDEHVHDQVARVRSCPWLLHVDDVRGCVLDVATGEVRAVPLPTRAPRHTSSKEHGSR